MKKTKLIRNIPERTMDGMKQHAAAQGKSVEQWIRDLLNKVAKERNSHEN